MAQAVYSSHAVLLNASTEDEYTLYNQGDTLYYADAQTVSVASSDGTVADAATLALTAPKWVISSGQSMVTLFPNVARGEEISTAQIAPLAVTTGKLAASAVTSAKIDSTVATTAATKVVPINTQTDNYTLALTDAGKCVEMDSTSNKTITIPLSGVVNFPVDTVIEVFRQNTGTVTIAITNTGTLTSPGSKVTLASRYSSGAIRKRATDTWVLSGDLA